MVLSPLGKAFLECSPPQPTASHFLKWTYLTNYIHFHGLNRPEVSSSPSLLFLSTNFNENGPLSPETKVKARDHRTMHAQWKYRVMW